MSGPYFEGQQPAACGCYYPDVTRLSDDPVNNRRLCFCVNHGEVTIPIEGKPRLDDEEVPSEAWRSYERLKLHNSDS